MLEYLIIGGGAAAGLLVGWVLSRRLSRRILAQAREQAGRIREQAQQAAALIVREMEAAARDEALRVRQASEALERQQAEENSLLEERLRKLEARNQGREKEAAARAEDLGRREQALEECRERGKQERQQAKDKRQAYRRQLEDKAGATAVQIRERLTGEMVEESRAQCQDRLRNLETTSAEEFTRQAKRTMGISMGRYSGHFLIERLVSTVALGPEGAGRLTESPDTLSTLESLTGVHLSVADSLDSVRFEGGDGAARELARRVVTRFLAEERVRDLPRLVKSLAADMDREIQSLGKEAFRLLGLELAHPEIVRLVGRLNFRTSYTQNQWRHAIEASFLAGLMAAELELDVKLARRATLLHDIGKALTHEVEGSHAAIGAEYARRFDEDDLVVNAIASHHGEEPPRSPYAFLVAAADAMSGARPGARRETVETYMDRISDLEGIATGFAGVTTVHAVQAGRELRVHVDEAQVNDARAAQLSEEIARKISECMTFPGQIRVTVIREFKAVEIAG